MRARTVLVVALVLGYTTLGCGGWFSELTKNPVYSVEQVLHAAERALEIARLIFEQIKPLLPAASQATAESRYRELSLGVVRAQEALAKGLELARRAESKGRELEGQREALVKAGQDLSSYLESLRGRASALPGASPGGAGSPEGVVGYGELQGALWLMGEVGR